MKTSYLSTSVPVERSKEQIRRLLIEEGMTGIQWLEEFGSNREIVRFAKPIHDPNTNAIVMYHTVVFDVQIPEAPKPKNQRPHWQRGRLVQPKPQKERQEQMRRAAFRAMYNILKAEFDSIRFGVRTFEQAFLAHMEFMRRGEPVTALEMMRPMLGVPALPEPRKQPGEDYTDDAAKEIKEGEDDSTTTG